MKATKDFTASINGVDIALKAGEKFEGTKAQAEVLLELGLISEASTKKEK